MSRIVDWPARMKEVAGFVGLDQDELEVIQSTRDLVLARGEELTAEVYDHFLKFPQARKFFLTSEGQGDQEKLDRRKHSLQRWLRGSIDFQIDAEYPHTAAGHRHRPHPSSDPPGPPEIDLKQIYNWDYLFCPDSTQRTVPARDRGPGPSDARVTGVEHYADGSD